MSQQYNHDSHSGHHHVSGHLHPDSLVEKALWGALIFNLLFLFIEVGVGLWSNSLALLSDAGHMVSDVAALAMALVAQRLIRVNPGGSFTYGLKRAPVLGAFGNSLTLLAIVALIFWEAGHRLFSPPEVPGWPVLYVGFAGLFVNMISAWWLHRSADESLNVKGAMLHLLADALGSLGAIIAALVLITTGWAPIDAIISFITGLLILVGTWPLLRDSAKVLLEAAPGNIDLKELRQVFSIQSRVKSILDLHVWELTSGRLALSAWLETDCDSLANLQEDGDALRQEMEDRYDIDHCTIEWRTGREVTNGCAP